LRSGASAASTRFLKPLARLYDLQPSFRSMEGELVHASPQSLLGALRAIGAPVGGMDDLPAAVRSRRLELWRRVVDLVSVAWDGRLDELRVRVPTTDLGGPFRTVIALEDGTERAWHPHRVLAGEREELEGIEFVELVTQGAIQLPLGYHRLHVEIGRSLGEALVIAAPRRAPPSEGRSWGVFLPLYALRTERAWGTGDFTALGDLSEWVGGLGGRWVATLPVLASFLEGPLFQPSPYSPASRLFWNELFLDVTAVPEFAESGEAQALVGSRSFVRDLERVRSSDLVDYRATMALKRRVLEILAKRALGGSSRRGAELRKLARSIPRLDDYAAFRAACERHGAPWPKWPDMERDGRLPRSGGNVEAHRYQRYAQLLAEEQLSRLAARCRGIGTGLYFDVPLGVDPAGYDVWRERGSFALEASAGAPPDTFFRGGQDWGFHPLHPESIRRTDYRYVIESLRHQCRHASVIRIDHVMWLHRLYWIPRGMEATDGVYARYRSEELSAVLALEAHRTGVVLVGEDLGTVPAYVRRTMSRHGMLRSYVLEMEVTPDPKSAIRRPSRTSVASLNTHDLPPFAAFWQGDDIRLRRDHGWVGERAAKAALRRRERLREAMRRFLNAGGPLPADERGERALILACLRYLAASPAAIATVNLEDLWLDPRPQNVPGTTEEFPNWRRRALLGLEEFREDPAIVSTLEVVDRTRRGKDQSGTPRSIAPGSQGSRAARRDTHP
jgi:4-alpha-glucanotransferase